MAVAWILLGIFCFVNLIWNIDPYLFIYIGSFMSGICCVLAWMTYHLPVYHTTTVCPSIGIPSVLEKCSLGGPRKKQDTRITGSGIIDQQLQKALGYILRDYIESWYYKHISLDEEFLVQVKTKSEEGLRVLAAQCKKADWLSLLTLQLIDELIQHFKMYKQAKERMRDQTLVMDDQRNSPMIDVDVEDVFFELEAALPQIQIMGKICCDEEAEKAYLESVSEMLLYLILPVDEFHNTALRYFLRDIFTCQVLLPFVNTLCEPDYVNRLVVSQFKESTLNAESFQASIRMCRSVDELIELEQFTKEEIATLRRTGSSEGDHQQLTSVQYILQLCQKAREKQIAIETGQYDMEESLNVGFNDSQKLPVVFRAEIPHYVISREEETDKTTVLYCVKVTCQHMGAHHEEWVVERQFTDFKHLHKLVENQFGLNIIVFPKLKDVNSTNPSKQEQCSRVLEGYLSKLLHYDLQLEYPDLLGTVVAFLATDNYSKTIVESLTPDSDPSPSPSPSPPLHHPSQMLQRSRSDSENRREHSVVTKPRKGSQPVDIRKDQVEKMKHQSSVPSGASSSPSVDRRSPVLGRHALKSDKSFDSILPGSDERLTSLTFDEDDDSVPLRILMALADEVFNLKDQSQWFRRSFTSTVQQLIRATYGDRLSLKIVTHVDKMTSSDQIAEYLGTVINYLWPDGVRAKPGPERTEAMQMRTKMAARAKLLGTIPDDLRRIIGSNTTHTGLSEVFDMFQHRKLNKRMAYCFLERLLMTLFPDNQLADTFKTLRGV